MSFGNRPTSRGSFDGSFSQYPQMDRREIHAFIDQHSVGVKYWKAIECPCTGTWSGQPNLACHSCRGLGWFYTNRENDPKYNRAQVVSRRSKEEQATGGRVTTGYASITFKPGVVPGDGDLIQVCKDREVVNNEYHIVGEKLTDGSTAETLRFRDVICVEKVVMWDKTSKEAEEIDRNRWNLNRSDRKIDFLYPVDVGSKYSVRYLAVPEYIVRADTAKPLLRVAHDENLPDPQRTNTDVIYPYNVQAVRLDRAILMRQRGQFDYDNKSTFNNKDGRGPFK